MKIQRKKGNRAFISVLHRVADIPGGVTVETATLGGNTLYEGTPIGRGSNGLFAVCKTARVLTEATAEATTYAVAKGHHFVVGGRIAHSGANGQTITEIDKSDPVKDVITVGTTLGVKVLAGDCLFESSGANKTLKVQPIAVVGDDAEVRQGDNLFVNAWLHAVVRESVAPAANESIKSSLKCVSYI